MKNKNIVFSENAPKAVGPYSVGTSANGFVFLSGQLGMDPKTGQFADGGVEAQTKQALENIKNILADQGLRLGNIVKTTVFLKDIKDFSKMNAIYNGFFTSEFPARSAVQVAALPKDGLVEIEVIAAM